MCEVQYIKSVWKEYSNIRRTCRKLFSSVEHAEDEEEPMSSLDSSGAPLLSVNSVLASPAPTPTPTPGPLPLPLPETLLLPGAGCGGEDGAPEGAAEADAGDVEFSLPIALPLLLPLRREDFFEEDEEAEEVESFGSTAGASSSLAL